jgi:hypothetical protein
MECAACHKRTRTLRYTKFLHLVPATALNLAMEYAEGVTTMEGAMRYIDGSDAKPCDTDYGGCGVMNGITHALAVAGTGATGGGGTDRGGGSDRDGDRGSSDGSYYGSCRGDGENSDGETSDGDVGDPRAWGIGGVARAPPAIFCLALTWESASAEREFIAQTLGNVSTSLDLASVYQRLPSGSNTRYKLRCVMCYYGEHYAAFAISEAAAEGGAAERVGWTEARGGHSGGGGGGGGGERWLLFDDATTKEVGGWENVVSTCEKGRLQPCVLFYQQEGAPGE